MHEYYTGMQTLHYTNTITPLLFTFIYNLCHFAIKLLNDLLLRELFGILNSTLQTFNSPGTLGVTLTPQCIQPQTPTLKVEAPNSRPVAPLSMTVL